MKKNYIVRGVGYIALLSAIIEQANEDIATEKARLEHNLINSGYDTDCSKNAIKDIEAGIKEWADIAAADINFKIYE